jgi:hypothetical protein
MNNIPGVTILRGPQDWQIIQRNRAGLAAIQLEGSWLAPETVFFVQARVVDENTNMPVTRHLDWADAELDRENRRFRITLEKVPQGGLYRVETRLKRPFAADSRPLRGDYIHHLGVGDIFVVAGQSNASGTGKGGALDGPALGVHLFANDERWKLAMHPLEDATNTRHPITITGIFHGHSPWLAFGKAIYRKTGIPVGLVPTALGGSLISRWLKSSPDSGDLFDNMADMVQKAGGEVAGVLWYQGESEVFQGRVADYPESFKKFVAATRELLKDPGLPVFTAQLNAFTAEVDPAEWSRMREIQRSLCHELPEVYLIVTVDCPLSDEVHLRAASNVWLGERYAQVVLEQVSGEPILSGYPEIEQVSFAGGTRQTLELSFANVAGDWTPNPAPGDFAVQDAAGWIPVQSLSFGQGGAIILDLARPASGPATVHGLYGASPRPTLFDDNGRCIVPFSVMIN